jgi:sec-independent protein translocase protein TatB
MLNVGPLELVVVLAVALIVVGPERLPELARSVGRALRQLRQVQDEVRDMVSAGVDDEVRQAAADFKKATGDIARSSGVDEITRKSGRTAGPRKATPTRRRSSPDTSAAAVPERPVAEGGPSASEPVRPEPTGASTRPEERPTGMEAEVAGPPADRLVEDGATPAGEAPPATDDVEDRATER